MYVFISLIVILIFGFAMTFLRQVARSKVSTYGHKNGEWSHPNRIWGKIRYSSFFDFTNMMAWISFWILLLMLLIKGVCYFEYQTLKIGYESLRETVTMAREDENIIERAAIITEIATMNKSIRSAQYWNQTQWGFFIPDFVMDIELFY